VDIVLKFWKERVNKVSYVLALAGGVGGAKLVLGLSKLLSPEELSIVVNTGDDEDFFGLHVSPDLDTVMYTLAGLSNTDTGWGLSGESFRTLERLKVYGAETWFNLGDLDFATHLSRTEMLKEGRSLSEITSHLCVSLGIIHNIAPMTDGYLRTMVGTAEGEMSFQEYFVKNRCLPVVKYLKFSGAQSCEASNALKDSLNKCEAIVFCPSNPFLSLDPILAVKGVKDAIANFSGSRIAISPIIGGQAIKGPAAKMMAELGHDVSPFGVAKKYKELCDIFVIDNLDFQFAPMIEELDIKVLVTNTLMQNEEDKITLADNILRAIHYKKVP
jgi:LPPG:FO 2-phospho-L-lactate transferase